MKYRYIFRSIFNKFYTFLVKLDRKISIGKGSILYYKSTIRLSSEAYKVYIGNNVTLGRTSKDYHSGMPFHTSILVDGCNAYVEIGDNCRINGAYIHAQKSIRIGNNCVIASGVNIMDSNGHRIYSKNRTIDRDDPDEILIGNNVWIGLNATILKGTIIGDNCVISAGSIVKGHYSQGELIVGNPAKTVKYIF